MYLIFLSASIPHKNCLSAPYKLLLKTLLSHPSLLGQHFKPVTYVEAVSVKCCHIMQFHPWFWFALTFEVLERSWCQSVSPNNSAILLWNSVVLLDNVYNYLPNYCKVYHLVNSKVQKWGSLLLYLEAEWDLHHKCDWLQLDLHVLTALFICGPKWSSLLYVNIYISLVQCPRAKFELFSTWNG